MLKRWLDTEHKLAEEAVPAASQTSPRHEVPHWLEDLRAERVLKYDMAIFPFEQLFCEMFETLNLAALHRAELSDHAPLCPTLLKAYHLAGLKRPKAWRQKEKWQWRHIQGFRNSCTYLRFLKLYDRFIDNIVVPLLDCGELLYQRPP